MIWNREYLKSKGKKAAIQSIMIIKLKNIKNC